MREFDAAVKKSDDNDLSVYNMCHRDYSDMLAELVTVSPIIAVAEGLFMYFSKEDTGKLLNNTAHRFEKGFLLVEMMNPNMMDEKKQEIVKSTNALFGWALSQEKNLAAWDGIRNHYTYWQFFWRFLTMLYLMHGFDMIFLDWYLLTRSRFFQYFYPETEGCVGYQQYGFNLREQLIKIALFPFLALLLAWVCTLF